LEREFAKEIEQRGEAKGKVEGKAEGKAEMARSLLANGVSPDIIAKSAGLSIEQVRNMMN
jgi:predicted transposase/invertase (TIGR01784 family)